MKRRVLSGLVSLGLVFVAMTVLAVAAGAAVPSLLAQAPEDGFAGTGAGRMSGPPRGVAASPRLPGDVYVTDSENARIDEFTPWGEFVRAWGWGVRDEKAELETCTSITGCLKGLEGGGSGEFKAPEAIAVDGEGHVYVIEADNHRVQKFDHEGNFLLAFGSAGSGPGLFAGGFGSYLNDIAVNVAADTVFVGEGEQIQVFDASGTFMEDIAMPAGKVVHTLAVDGAGKLYVGFANDPKVRKLEPHGPNAVFLAPSFEVEPEPPFSTPDPMSLVLDGNGDLYMQVHQIEAHPSGAEPQQVLEFDPAGNCLDCQEKGEGGKPGFDRTSPLDSIERSVAAGGACGSSDVYVAHYNGNSSPSLLSFVRVFGDPPDSGVCPPPRRAPLVTEQYALSVTGSDAELQARVNPRFWNDTTFRVEYGQTPCSQGGCASTADIALVSKTAGVPLKTSGVVLAGLSPGATYYYRFVAQSSGGGPVYGVDPDGEGPGEASFAEGSEGSFTTYRSGSQDCPVNGAFRTGASALLPDCRAYEMVSPVNKEGGDIFSMLETKGRVPAVLQESASSGERLAYGSYRAFANAESSPYTVQYIASRHAGVGWVTHSISPPRSEPVENEPVLGQTEPEFKAFSNDLCVGWLQTLGVSQLDPAAPAGATDLYRRSDGECGEQAYTALNTIVPPAPFHEALELQGLSANGSVGVFGTPVALAAGGSEGLLQLYGSSQGLERFLCVLPGGEPNPGPCIAGGTIEGIASGGKGRENNVTGAVSEDGTKVFWTALKSGKFSGGPGQIYVREYPFGGEPECAETGASCTVAVSRTAEEIEKVSRSQFQLAASDGSRVLFTTNETLYEYRLGDESTHRIAGEIVNSALGASVDASRVYFASREALGGVNAEGKSAAPGDKNLYFYETGTGFRFIASLADQSENGSLGALDGIPLGHAARVSPDGLHAVFGSHRSLTGYENTDTVTGQPDEEVYLYDATANGGQGGLVCASCNPSGARPEGGPEGAVAAKIPGFESMLYGTWVLSDDGKRVFFESYDALSPRDDNGKKDVYQWEEPGTGGCSEHASGFSPFNHGCVDLISSGQSKFDSEFIDASPSGNDVFIATLSSLVPQDPGLIDIYDARVNGGFAAPVSPPVCEGEACQSPAVAPLELTPASFAFSGAGNLLGEPPTPAGVKTRKLTGAQQLARALRACRTKPKHKRQACERNTRKKFRAKRGRSSAVETKTVSKTGRMAG